MNKKEFASALSKSVDIESNVAAGRITELAIDIITKELVSGGIVDLFGLGKFSAVLQKGRSGTIPGSDKTYVTNDKMVPKFKACAALKRATAVQ